MLQVNYEFHGPLTGDDADDRRSTSTSAGKRVARTISGTRGAELIDGSTRRAIVTKFLRERPDDSWTIDAALGNGAYDGL